MARRVSALRAAQGAALVALLGLIALALAWEIWLAPLRPGGSWLMLKALPLLLPLRGVLAGRRCTFQWASMFILAYLAEGLVRAVSDPRPSAWLAGAQAALAIVFFTSALAYARLSPRGLA
ncbi:MAG: DUF2069 domain-containing protein [Burkholderiales bacterium]|nr:DUF2069 domain-containing protein [Burkholderiales bacterium]